MAIGKKARRNKLIFNEAYANSENRSRIANSIAEKPGLLVGDDSFYENFKNDIEIIYMAYCRAKTKEKKKLIIANSSEYIKGNFKDMLYVKDNSLEVVVDADDPKIYSIKKDGANIAKNRETALKKNYLKDRRNEGPCFGACVTIMIKVDAQEARNNVSHSLPRKEYEAQMNNISLAVLKKLESHTTFVDSLLMAENNSAKKINQESLEAEKLVRGNVETKKRETIETNINESEVREKAIGKFGEATKKIRGYIKEALSAIARGIGLLNKQDGNDRKSRDLFGRLYREAGEREEINGMSEK